MDTNISTHDDDAPGALARLADWCVLHRRRVVVLWAATLLVGIGLLVSAAGDFASDSSAGGSESQRAYEILQERFPSMGGDTIDVVVEAPEGVEAPVPRQRLEELLSRAVEVPHVSEAVDPYSDPGGRISADGRVAFASLRLDLPALDVPVESVTEVIALAEATDSPELRVDLAGAAVSEAQAGPPSEGFALLAAALVLLVAFGSVLATGLPILVAVFGLGVAAAVVGVLMNVISVTSTAPAIAAMVGLGVGIDYALLIVSRYRGYLHAGMGVRAAVVTAVTTAGRSVVFAGSTVVVALLGMLLLREPSMYGLTIATIVVVATMVVVSVTLLPALLAFTGHSIDRLTVPGLGRGARTGRAPMARRWTGLVLRHPWAGVASSLLLLLLLALPALDMRLGLPDAGNDPADYTTRQAYDRLAGAFGPGVNGPLVLVAELPDEVSQSLLRGIAERDLSAVPGVVEVSPPLLSPDGSVAVISVVPATGPQEPATAALVDRLRDDSLPALLAGTGIRVSVGGATAAGVDMTAALSERLPWFVAGSILLSVGLLTVLLRSPVVAVKAAVMNLFSVGAAFGVVTYATSGTWLGELIGLSEPVPAPAFAVLLMFAILFGLSMDYEIFLMSRIREAYVRTRDNDGAVAEGLTATARVITAAAAVMIVVFGAFVFSEAVFLKAVGVGMAAAILIDATVVRLVLVPAALKLMGDRNWWLPAWLDRVLPRVSSEGREPVLPPEPVIGGRHRPGRAAPAPVGARPGGPPPQSRNVASLLVAQRDALGDQARLDQVVRDVQALTLEVRRLGRLLEPDPSDRGAGAPPTLTPVLPQEEL